MEEDNKIQKLVGNGMDHNRRINYRARYDGENKACLLQEREGYKACEMS